MNNLQIFSRGGQLYTDSREVAKMIGKDHAHLMRDIAGYIEILSQSKIGFADFFVESTYLDTQKKLRPCYSITKKGCEFVANKLTGEKGVLFTAAYVNAFHSMEDKLTQSQLPSTYLDALKALVESEESKQQLLARVEADKPKVLFADAVSTAKTSILVGELAKIMKQNGIDTGEKRLFEWLRENGYLIKRYGTDYNAPTQKSMDLGLFEVKETSINHSDGHVTVSKTTKVTGKGQQYFINKFIGKKSA